MPDCRNSVVPVNTFRPLLLGCLVALLAGTAAAPLSGRGSADQQPAASQAQPGQNRQGPRQNRPGPTEVGWEWWRDEAAIKELGLAPEKAKLIDRYYISRQRNLKAFVDEYVKQRDLLNKMTEERAVDADTYALQVKKVEMLRSELFESRTVMLYRIYLELRPDQYQKLREITDRRRSGRGGAH
jgi:hypothetical protein